MRRRGEISMEVIIIAAIALLVLVILAVLILRAGTGVGKGTNCESPSIGGTCAESCDIVGEGHIPSTNACPNPDDICCVPLLDDA